jgi:hypothetical protein
MTDKKTAIQVIEALRRGIPPQRGVELYAVGNEKLIDGIKKRHLSNITNSGIIRFVNGSWGAGKTHFFRQLREVSFQNNCLVSNVELGINIAALNKFESIFAAIIRQISTPSYYSGEAIPSAAPFSTVLQESLAWLSIKKRNITDEITHEQFLEANTALMADSGIDIDFKKMVQKYWETFLPEAPDPVIVEQIRGEILQWFTGEGTIGFFRKNYGVNKIVAKDNAKFMLQSLAEFVRLSGYNGLVILFDEAEQAYAAMTRASLKDAHNNLLTLINNIETLPGLFLIYATTPDFFTDPKHGIVIYGALTGRIGKPEDRPPMALDTIWNLDSVETKLEDYQEAARKIREVYQNAYPDSGKDSPSDEDITNRVRELFAIHTPLASVRFWRLLVTAIISDLDDRFEGRPPRETEGLYDDVMERLREA